MEKKVKANTEENVRLEKKLKKQSATLKQKLEEIAVEATKASENPWEDEDWEGLSALEKFEMLKHELVPAQQARLSKMCLEELTDQLEESKNCLTKSLLEKETLREDVKKLETKLHFLENPKIEAPTEKTKTEAQQKKVPEKVESASGRRRSTRSASSLAPYKISETLTEGEESPKKRKARDLNESRVEKRAHKEPVAVETEDRGALCCITNSPLRILSKRKRIFRTKPQISTKTKQKIRCLEKFCIRWSTTETQKNFREKFLLTFG